jgi:Flp pilus assembly protein CpaB
MSAKNIKLLVLSVVMGLVAAFVSTRGRPQEPTVTVLVAKQPIPRYASLRDFESMFTLQEFAGYVQLPPNHLKSFEPLKEKGKDYLIAKPMKAGEVLSLDYIIDKGQGGLAALLRPGYVGLAIRVAADSSVSGLISPDD